MGTAHGQIARARATQRIGVARARWLVLAGAIVAALALTVGLSTAGYEGASVANAAVERAKTFLQLLQQRSPGSRTKAVLVKTKHKRVVVHERALPKVRMAMANIP